MTTSSGSCEASAQSVTHLEAPYRHRISEVGGGGPSYPYPRWHLLPVLVLGRSFALINKQMAARAGFWARGWVPITAEDASAADYVCSPRDCQQQAKGESERRYRLCNHRSVF